MSDSNNSGNLEPQRPRTRTRTPTPSNGEAAVGQHQQERFEWQAMLESVLTGEVLKSETQRLLGANSFSQPSTFAADLWLQLRSYIHKVSKNSYQILLTKLRSRVDSILEQVITFQIDENSAPLEQVQKLLESVEKVEELYPTRKQLKAEKPLYASEAFQRNLHALISWMNITTELTQQISILQVWTGSPTLEIVSAQSSQPDNLEPSLSFLDRLLKSERTTKPEQTRFTQQLPQFLLKLRDTIINQNEAFRALNLPIDYDRIQLLAKFPGKLAEELLKLRLNYSARITGCESDALLDYDNDDEDSSDSDSILDRGGTDNGYPSALVVEQLLEDFKNSIELAITVRQQYLSLTAFRYPSLPSFNLVEPAKTWALYPDLSEDFDRTILSALKFYFKLLEWKLAFNVDFYPQAVMTENEDAELSMDRSKPGATLVKEFGLLEKELQFFSHFAGLLKRGDLEVALEFCKLTEKLFNNVRRYYTYGYKFRPVENVPCVKLVKFYDRILDLVRSRSREVMAFFKTLFTQFKNSTDLTIASTLPELIHALQETGHVLIRPSSIITLSRNVSDVPEDISDFYSCQGVYIFGAPSLADSPAKVQQMFSNVLPRLNSAGLPLDFEYMGLMEQNAVTEKIISEYLVLVSIPTSQPTKEEELSFDIFNPMSSHRNVDVDPEVYRMVENWSGPTMSIVLPTVPLALPPYSMRITSLNHSTLSPSASKLFDLIPFIRNFGVKCQSKANHALLDHAVNRVGVSSYRFAECLLKSVDKIRATIGDETLRPAEEETQLQNLGDSRDSDQILRSEFVETLFSFATDYGHRLMKLFPPPHATISENPLNPLLVPLIELCISWIDFTCSTHSSSDRKTFRWALMSLEFAMQVTKGNAIVNIEEDLFNRLRRTVGECMSLLLSCFDIEGARASSMQFAIPPSLMHEAEEQQDLTKICTSANVPEHVLDNLRTIEIMRNELQQQNRLIGRVLDDKNMESDSLAFLASSSSSISIRWQHGKYLGGGSYGSVYLGINLDTGELLAVKEIKVQDPNNWRRFKSMIQEEMAVMEKISHPNIVQYIGVEVHRDKVYLFMEYVPSGSLSTLLENGPVMEEPISFYTYQMLRGLQYLHSKKIVHRDVKPDNILLDENGVIKFIDFGAAKILKNQRTLMGGGGTGSWNQQSGNMSLIGTPNYMSPETILGSRESGKIGCQDVWSLGCVITEMFTGKAPYAHLDNQWAVIYQIALHPPQLPEPPAISPAGLDFLKKCFTRNPKDRPTVDELLQHEFVRHHEEEYELHILGLRKTGASSGRARTPSGTGSSAGSVAGSIAGSITGSVSGPAKGYRAGSRTSLSSLSSSMTNSTVGSFASSRGTKESLRLSFDHLSNSASLSSGLASPSPPLSSPLSSAPVFPIIEQPVLENPESVQQTGSADSTNSDSSNSTPTSSLLRPPNSSDENKGLITPPYSPDVDMSKPLEE